jgi:hypothetical protein
MVRAAVRNRLVAACLLMLTAPLLILAYTQNVRLGFVLETNSAGLTALSLVRDGDFGIEEFFPPYIPHDVGYAARWRGKTLYSIEPVASSLTFTPFFLPYRNAEPRFWRPERINNLVAAQVAVLTVIVIGWWLLSIATVPRALVATGIFALATSHRTISGAGLWQHTSGGLWLAVGLFAWSHARRWPALFPVAGAALALATACRPIFVAVPILAALDAWFLARTSRKTFLSTSVLVVSIGSLALYANWHFHGSLVGGRIDLVRNPTMFHSVKTYFHFSPVHLLGLLTSPSRGLFVYSPVLLFAVPGLMRSLRKPTPEGLRLITIAGILTFLLYGFISTWWAGSVFGPRYMTDLLPFFALWLTLTPIPAKGRPVLAVCFAAALAWSLWVQQLGENTYPCNWNHTPVLVDRAPQRVWDWRDSQIARCAGWVKPPPTLY